MYEFGFSSAASFNKYCKKNFGNSPRELVRQLKDKHIDNQNLKI
ncbi:helix-turn-helix domain-containing protein [Bacteroides fragilis]|nr:helix-turn-helix domain-containing protein [Bacteroides fragilis]